MSSATAIRAGRSRSYTIPTDAPEADGTIAWESTTMVLVELEAGDQTGLGYSYAHKSAALVARELVEKHCLGHDAMDTRGLFDNMRRSQRNYGTEGIAGNGTFSSRYRAVGSEGKIARHPLAKLLGICRDSAPVYGSGGFTSYDDSQLRAQLGGWVEEGIPRVKMKIGTNPPEDPHRVATAREAIGDATELFVDANGAYSRKQALYFAQLFAEKQGVKWFEEPVSSDDLEGLRLLRDRAPAGMDIAAGEYGWNALYLRRMIDSGAVDVIQADATRCGGVTGFMQAAALADAHPLPLSAHCGPTIHMHLACAAPPLRHVEYFHDHVRIERMLFDGFREAARDGAMHPDFTRPGLGIELKKNDAERFADDL